MVKVTTYIPAYNYGKYIEKAIESVFNQTMTDWELIVIDDGSTDNTTDILNQYKKRPKTRIIRQENKGLNVTNNIALRLANGKYIMRLDADDILDENALLLLSNILDTKPDIGLVYPDYYEVDTHGEILQQVRRKKIGEEVELLDLPAHGACTMFRKELLTEIGGYIETFTCQDGYELWLRFIEKYNPYNINLPLFYYRQHPLSLTKNEQKILDTRQQIKRQYAKKKNSIAAPKVMGFIPATGNSAYAQNDPFLDLNGKPLLWYTLSSVNTLGCLDKIILSSEDDRVLDYAKAFPKILPHKRKEKFAQATLKMQDLVLSVLNSLESESNYTPDAVCTLYINTPLRQNHHIQKAIDTMTIFNVDSVISVQEELSHCYHHRKFGLEPINTNEGGMRIERKSIYRENGSIFLSRTEVIKSGQLLGKKIGHITMLPHESIKINTAYDLWLTKEILCNWNKS